MKTILEIGGRDYVTEAELNNAEVQTLVKIMRCLTEVRSMSEWSEDGKNTYVRKLVLYDRPERFRISWEGDDIICTQTEWEAIKANLKAGKDGAK